MLAVDVHANGGLLLPWAPMIVVVHGYDGSGPGHWQHWLTEELSARGAPVRFPQFTDPQAPVCDVWVRELAQVIAESRAPVTLVAHSLGCWAVDHYVARHGAEKLRAALLVAPPSPYSLFEPIQSFLPPPRSATAWASLAPRTLVVGSDDDDYAGPEEFTELAETLGVKVQIFPGTGHLNAAAGFGPWPFALEWLAEVGAL